MNSLSQHSLVQHYLAILRDKTTQHAAFREAAEVITRALVFTATENLKLDAGSVDTPLEEVEVGRVAKPIVVVPILRAGLSMLDASLAMLPDAKVGYIGMERDEATAEASCYYSKMPDLAAAQKVLVLDPMLATGGSAVHAISELKQLGATDIDFVCIIAAPEGVDALHVAHPDVEITCGVVDRELNEKKYICPGLGDFGDRLYGTD